MRSAVLPFLLALAACDPAAAPDDAGPRDSCDGTLGVLRVCIYGDAASATTLADGSATARRDASDIPWMMRAGDDGCTEERMEPGTWELSATDSTGTCTTPFTPVEIRACEVTEIRAEVDMYCVDG